MTVKPGLCQSVTNTYVLSGTIAATNVPSSGTLTISSGAFAPRSLTLPVGNATGTFSYSGLVSNGQTYTVTASYSNGACAPVSQAYTAPASCSVAPVCSLSATATAGLCVSATNTYSASVVIQMTNAVAGIISVSLPGSSPISQAIAANTSSFTAVFTGLPSDGASHTATINLPGCGTTTAAFTAPVSCSVAPVCSLTAVATAGLCQTATNTFTNTVVVRLTNPTAGILTVTDGPASLTFATTAVSSATYTATFNGIASTGSLHTVTATLPGCSATTTTYTAPASCSTSTGGSATCSVGTPVVTAGLCASATNTYSTTAVVTVQNPASGGTLTISNGTTTQPFTTTAGTSNTFTMVFNGLSSDGLSHIITATLAGCGSSSATYTAPASCSTAAVCSISPVVTAGICASATNTYSATTVVTLSNPPAGVLTVVNGAKSLTTTIASGLTSFTFTAAFNGLVSDGATHTVTASLPGCSSQSVNYTAPISCSVAPACSVSAVATHGLCASATNTFSNTVTVTLTNPTAGVLTVTDGPASLTYSVPATSGTVTVSSVFNGLSSNGATRTVNVSLPGCANTTLTYSAPASCSTASLCSVGTPVVTAGVCNSATNTYSTTAVVTVQNPTGGATLTISNGLSTQPFTTTAGTSNTFTMVFNGMPSNGSAATITATLAGCGSTSATFTAPASCSTAAVCSINPVVTAGTCASATNTYSATAVVTLTNPPAGILTVVNGAQSLTTTIAGGLSSFTYTATFNGLTSDGATHTVTISLPGCGSQSINYTAPVSCSTAVACSVTTPLVTAGACASATNTYSATAVVTLSNTTAGVLTVTNAGQSLTTTVAAGLSNFTFTATFNGLSSDGLSHSITANLTSCGSSSATYTAPASCTTGTGSTSCSMGTPVVTAGVCNSATNTFSTTVVVTVQNPTNGGTLNISNGVTTQPFTTTAGTANTFTMVFNGLPSDGLSHSITTTLAGCGSASATYTAPVSCSTASLCSISPVVTVGLCTSATNTYSTTAVVRLSNPTAGILTVVNGAQSLTTTIASGLSSFTYTATFNGLVSDGVSHVITASLAGCGSQSVTYSAPASCTTGTGGSTTCAVGTPVVTTGVCNSATNTYSTTAVVTVQNPASGGTLSISNGTTTQPFTTTAGTANTFTMVFNGLSSNGATGTITATLAGCGSTSATYSAPVSCSSSSGCPPFTLSPSSLPNGLVGSPYNATLVASGGTAPYSFSVTSGTLPAGLALSPAGILSGTPTGTGSFGITVRISDNAGCFHDLDPGILAISANPNCPPARCIPLVVKRLR